MTERQLANKIINLRANHSLRDIAIIIKTDIPDVEAIIGKKFLDSTNDSIGCQLVVWASNKLGLNI